MLDHIVLNVRDYETSKRFYEARIRELQNSGTDEQVDLPWLSVDPRLILTAYLQGG